jgi:hypothetical protein
MKYIVKSIVSRAMINIMVECEEKQGSRGRKGDGRYL